MSWIELGDPRPRWEGKWEEALEQYTFGLESAETENIPPDQKGLLLSNRRVLSWDPLGPAGTRWDENGREC